MMEQVLPKNFPHIAKQSRQQMKDVELVSQLLLLIEEGVKAYSQYELDEAFSIRDASWEAKVEVEETFRVVIDFIKRLTELEEPSVAKTRLKNQADFYSLFGSISQIHKDGKLAEVDPETAARRLCQFTSVVDDDRARSDNRQAAEYYEAVRSASNDVKPRNTRIAILKDIILGE